MAASGVVSSLESAFTRILSLVEESRNGPCPLVGLSGIDGSGKSRLAAKLAARIEESGVRVALLGVDDWHNPPEVRFSRIQPGPHFFDNGLRLDEMFARLVKPLKQTRSVESTIDARQSADKTPRRKTIAFRDVDLILVEGIFIFRRELRRLFDVAMWVDCPFDVALERARARNQEGLADDEIIRDYLTIYFPAQLHHFERDWPRESADVTIRNGALAGMAVEIPPEGGTNDRRL
jgi:uridine kinase